MMDIAVKNKKQFSCEVVLLEYCSVVTVVHNGKELGREELVLYSQDELNAVADAISLFLEQNKYLIPEHTEDK